MKPKLSIVMTARNDNYGGHLIGRIQSSIQVLIYLTNLYHYETELIIVEYNPPVAKPRLHEILQIQNNRHLTIRFIDVPNSYHKTLPLSDKSPFFEYIAKNIGVRRASSDFILSTNLDILFSDQFFAYLSTHSLDTNAFYRVNRCDIPYREFPVIWSGKKILERSEQSAFVALTEKGISILRPFSILGLKSLLSKYLYPLLMYAKYGKMENLDCPLHERAAGDFLLMQKDIWKKIKGFSELPISGYLDGYILYHAYCLGVSQIVLPYPIYHMYHEYDRKGRPTKELSTYIKDRNTMFETKKMIMQNKKHWGADDTIFKEKIFSRIP